MNDCRKIQDYLLTDYMDGGATPQDTAMVDAHLRDCADCRAMLEAARANDAALRTAPSPALQADLWPDIRARIEQENSRAAFGWQALVNNILGARPRAAWAMAALTAVLVLGAMPWVLERTANADESAAVLAMLEENAQAVFSDEAEIDTGAGYILQTKGDVI